MGVTFFEVAFDLGHLIGHMGKANHWFVSGGGKSIERGRFHLDGEQAAVPHGVNRFFRFPERGICGPGCTCEDRNGEIIKGPRKPGH